MTTTTKQQKRNIDLHDARVCPSLSTTVMCYWVVFSLRAKKLRVPDSLACLLVGWEIALSPCVRQCSHIQGARYIYMCQDCNRGISALLSRSAGSYNRHECRSHTNTNDTTNKLTKHWCARTLDKVTSTTTITRTLEHNHEHTHTLNKHTRIEKNN